MSIFLNTYILFYALCIEIPYFYEKKKTVQAEGTVGTSRGSEAGVEPDWEWRDGAGHGAAG